MSKVIAPKGNVIKQIYSVPAKAAFEKGAMSVFFIYLLVVNGFVFLLYGYDKWLARRKGRRIAEKTLHQWTLLGGSLGAFLAQKCFRHKTLKKSFQRMYWLIVILQLIVLILLAKNGIFFHELFN